MASGDGEDWGKAARGFCGIAAGGEDSVDSNDDMGDFKEATPAAAAFLSRSR